VLPDAGLMLPLNGGNMRIQQFCCIGTGQLNAINLDQTGISTIARLSFGRCPHAVIFTVWLIAVQSFKSMARRTLSHVSKELQKSCSILSIGKPSGVYSYSSATITGKIFVGWFFAALYHSSPRNPGRAIGHSMASVAFGSFFSKASAALRVAAGDIATSGNKLYTAMARVHGFSTGESLDMRYHGFYLTEAGGRVNA